MSHYFHEKQNEVESDERTLSYEHAGRPFTFKADRGVFAKGGVDFATRLLIEHLEVAEDAEKALDLGTGYGVIGIVIAARHGLEVTMTDVNERALALAARNLEENDVRATVLKSDGFAALERERFDLIVTNPPLRIGKKRLLAMLEAAADHLRPGGSLWLVVHKNKGAATLKAHLKRTYTVSTVKRKKGFHVIACRVG